MIYLDVSKTCQILAEILAKAISPPPDITVSEWADKHRILSGKACSEPGEWRTARAPYTKEVMDSFSDPMVEEVVCMWASQLAKTEVILNVTGYFIDVDPCPIVISQPTLPLARYFSRARLAPTISATEPLAAKIAEPKSRDADNTTLSKGFQGGQIDIVSAQSAADLSARPARVALGDEIDRYEDTSEGDPLELLDARTSNFPFRKKGYFSSPRDKGTSRIEAKYEESDKRKWWVPCPHCDKHQVLSWHNVKWDKQTDDNGELVRDEDGKTIHLPKTAQYFCEHCGAGWTESERHAAIRAGEWRAEKPSNGIAGFWLSAIYSPWRSLAQLVDKWLKAQVKVSRLRTFTNTVLAETWEESGALVSDDALVRRAKLSSYKAGDKLPAEAVVLTAASDTQDDRFELEVVAWGADYESWQVKHVVLTGDPARPELWEELAAFLGRTWETVDRRVLPLRAVGIDSGGHFTELVLKFCRPRWHNKVWALKGVSKGLYERVWPATFSRSRKSRDKFWSINVDAAKKAVTDWLKVDDLGPGYCHFPKGTPAAFFKQYRAERLATKYNKNGFPKKVWQARTGRRNEALDLRAYNYAVLCGLERMGFDLNREAERVANAPPPEKQNKKTNTAPPTPGGASISGQHAGFTPMADPWASNTW